MLVTKIYSLPTLAALCGLRDSNADGAPSCIESVLEWHELRDGGPWLKAPPGLRFPVEREVLSWHPSYSPMTQGRSASWSASMRGTRPK